MIKTVTAAGAAAVALPLLLILIVTASPAPPAATAAPAGLDGAATGIAIAGIPPQYLMWYMDAAQTCPGLPWSVLAGIGEVESDHGRSPCPACTAARTPPAPRARCSSSPPPSASTRPGRTGR